jgi:hypothetical protein
MQGLAILCAAPSACAKRASASTPKCSNALTALADQSRLQVLHEPEGEPRLVTFEFIREYARERLRKPGTKRRPSSRASSVELAAAKRRPARAFVGARPQRDAVMYS